MLNLPVSIKKLFTSIGNRNESQDGGSLIIPESQKNQNIYYCCTQKTASQWFKAIFNDPIIAQRTGFKVFPFDLYLEKLHETYPAICKTKWDFGPLLYRDFKRMIALPPHTIATHFYISVESYRAIPKPQNHKTFFILRDPRDLVISWYYSMLYSHSPIGTVLNFRSDLEKLDLSDGLNYSVNTLNQRGIFHVQRSWLQNSSDQESIKVFRYEDFSKNNDLFLKSLFDYLEIMLSNKEFKGLCRRHQFKKFSSGRTQGQENLKSHYRKGVSGDWRNYFKPNNIDYFHNTTGNLLKILGYD